VGKFHIFAVRGKFPGGMVTLEQYLALNLLASIQKRTPPSRSRFDQDGGVTEGQARAA
jgi:hypothetical protein